VKLDLSSLPSGTRSLSRLAALARLDESDKSALEQAAESPQRFNAHQDIVREGMRALPPSIVLTGWACRVRHFPDGRRQILGLLLPGELIGRCHQQAPLAATTVIALTPATLCAAPLPADMDAASGLAEAYAVSGAMEEFHLFRHIARLGRMNAYDRLLDWMLEVRERQALAGLATSDTFPMPLTQEALADTLGLTSVHVNRTLQLLRHEGLIELRSGWARLIDRERLEKLVDYRSAEVSSLNANDM
jgi:CRP-like cAMP-binding protein